MAGKIMMGLIVAAIIVVFVLVAKKSLSDGNEDTEKNQKNEKVKIKIGSGTKPKTQFVVGLEIFIYDDKGEVARSCQVNKSTFTIGSGSNQDLIISDDECVSAKHCVIERSMEDKDIFYTITNRSKKNPLEYYDVQSGEGSYFGKDEEMVITEEELFYVGNTLIKLKPSRPVRPERMVKKNENNENRRKTTRVVDEDVMKKAYRHEKAKNIDL